MFKKNGPLSGIRVLDLTRYIAGPYCTKLFADLGADVIKIEKPDKGDPARQLEPLVGDDPETKNSAVFLYLNTNKRSVCLDLKDQNHLDVLKKLVLKSDLLVENFRPGVMESLGLGYENLERLNPGLVMVSISNFGQTGPYRDWLGTETTLNAFTGMMSMTGLGDRAPLRLGLHQVQYTAGVTAAVAALAAHRYAQSTGRGQHVDSSLVEPMINTIHQQIARYGYWGSVETRGATADFPFFVDTQNCWIHISPLWMQDLVDFIGLPELDNEKFTDLVSLRQNSDEFKQIILPWFKERDGLAIFHESQARGIAWAPVHDEAQLLACPQFEARDYFVEIEHPTAGKALYPGLYYLSDQIERQKYDPAPQLGQHTEEVLNETDSANNSLGLNFPPASPELTLPLSGIRILSTEHWAALPHATKYLAGLGAEVITVESLRHTFQGLETKSTTSGGGLYQEGARNKKSITLDLSSPEGVEVFKRLAAICDVVTDNFSPRVMKNFGLDYEALKKIKPDIIVMSLSGYGHKGPWYLYRGYAVTTEAAGGLVNFTGYEDGPPMRPGGTPYGDMIPALHAAWTLMVALENRKRTGQGAFMDMSMLEPLVGQFGEAVVHHSLTGKSLPRMGNRDLNAAPSGCYPSKGEDKWVTIAAADEEQWINLVDLMGNPDWANEERFLSLETRLNHQDELDQKISAWTRELTNQQAMKLCQDAGVSAGAVINVPEVMSNEHFISRGAFEVIQHAPEPEGVGKRLHIGPPWKLSKTPASSVQPASPSFGRDNDYVFRELMGMSDEELADLEKKGILGIEPLEEPREILINPAYFGEREEDFLKVLGLE